MGRMNRVVMAMDTCELCGVDVWDGDSVCRKCRKKIHAERRVLRLVKAKRKERSYGRV